MRRAAESEWNAADKYSISRNSTIHPPNVRNPAGYRPEMVETASGVTYHGREFRRRGIAWPYGYSDSARLSSDDGFLTVYGWDGVLGICSDLAFFCRDDIRGDYYVGIYNVASADPVLSLSGKFKNLDFSPFELFRLSAWISKDLYVFPTDNYKRNRFLFCDLARAAEFK